MLFWLSLLSRALAHKCKPVLPEGADPDLDPLLHFQLTVYVAFAESHDLRSPDGEFYASGLVLKAKSPCTMCPEVRVTYEYQQIASCIPSQVANFHTDVQSVGMVKNAVIICILLGTFH